MRIHSLIFAVLILISGLVSCESDTVCVCPEPDSAITGTVSYSDSLKGAQNALVYLSYDNPLQYSDTVRTDTNGVFLFEEVQKGPFYLFAGITDDPDSEVFTFMSPVSDEMDNADLYSFNAGNMFLYQVSEESVISGNVISLETDPPGLPVENADVHLTVISIHGYGIEYSTTTDVDGNYSFDGVKTGTYRLYAVTPAEYAAGSEIFCDGSTAFIADTLILQYMEVKKPAIYIYPERDGDFLVELEFLNGTALTASIPEYASGWDVFVETTGIIDHQYDYLFYEASIRNAPDISAGWSISRDDLAVELRGILSDIGLNEKETDDFLAYWTNHLTDYEYYSVYPVFDDALDQFVELRVSPEPDIILRFWLFFEGNSASEALPLPGIPDFQRGPTTVVEWGGVLLDGISGNRKSLVSNYISGNSF